jgi:hypothetical protein
MVFGEPELRLTAAPLALKDQIIVGAAGGDRGVRDWVAALDPTTGRGAARDQLESLPAIIGIRTERICRSELTTSTNAVWAASASGTKSATGS